MADPRFFSTQGAIRLDRLAELSGASLADGIDPSKTISGVAPLDDAGPADIAFLEAKKFRRAFGETKAGACFVPPDIDLDDLAPGTARLVVQEPKRAFAAAIDALFTPIGETDTMSLKMDVDPDARLGDGVVVGRGAVIGARAQIGAGTIIGPGAVIGPGVAIGRDCRLGANTVVQFTVMGDRVHVHPNTSIGQDGFGYVFSGGKHQKITQIGRVVIQDDVEIGSNTTIDRGGIGDTIVGEGSKIDNLVQVAHNCRIGRGCIVVGQVGLSGSTILEDFVVLGGQVGCAGHLTIGAGSQVAARSGVPKDLPAGGIYGGAPARPVNEWRREIGFLSRVAKGKIGTVAEGKGRTDERDPEDGS